MEIPFFKRIAFSEIEEVLRERGPFTSIEGILYTTSKKSMGDFQPPVRKVSSSFDYFFKGEDHSLLVRELSFAEITYTEGFFDHITIREFVEQIDARYNYLSRKQRTEFKTGGGLILLNGEVSGNINIEGKSIPLGISNNQKLKDLIVLSGDYSRELNLSNA